MDAALQDLVPRRARFRCEYCLLPEGLVTTPFQFDHIIAESHGGETTAENLAYACFHCNNFKGPNLAGIDSQSGEVIRLVSNCSAALHLIPRANSAGILAWRSLIRR